MFDSRMATTPRRCGGAAKRQFPSSRGQTAPTLRAHRIGPSGRRGAGRLPGRCLPGPCRSGSSPGLGRGHFDRRHQCCDHRRKSAGISRRQASGVLGAGQLSTDAMAGTIPPCSQRRSNGGQSARREPAAQRRSRAIGAEPLVGGFGPVVGRDGVFHTSRPVAVALPGRVNGGHQLLRHAAVGANAPATDRFRSRQRWPHAPQCRRRQRADRRLRLLRQHDPPHRAQTHHGEWCLAARLSGGRDRRRTLLGWWPCLEHAAGLDGGCRAGEGHTGVPGRSVVRARRSFLAA